MLLNIDYQLGISNIVFITAYYNYDFILVYFNVHVKCTQHRCNPTLSKIIKDIFYINAKYFHTTF